MPRVAIGDPTITQNPLIDHTYTEHDSLSSSNLFNLFLKSKGCFFLKYWLNYFVMNPAKSCCWNSLLKTTLFKTFLQWKKADPF